MLTFESWLSTLYIHNLIENEPGKWNVGMLADTLGKSRRTIHRYLRELNKCGAPLEYDYKTKGFRYTEEWRNPAPLQPLLNMTDRQLRALRRSIEQESHLRELKKDPRRYAKVM
ncbi:MAG: HTH domain-containing protein [Myxococcales bacterium]|nr:HTH domain-containing protein [Myxococcales bacterium]